MKNLVIITPCSRPENLTMLHKSILNSNYGLYGDWCIVRDTEISDTRQLFQNKIWIWHSAIKGGIAGKLQINKALDFINYASKKGSWIYVLDDDNLMHPDFMKTISAAIDTHPDARAFTFSQQLPDGSVRLGNEIQVYHIDQAQFVVHTDLIGDLRYLQQYEADGIFIETLYKQHPDKFVILPQVISYYNKLRW